MDGWEGGGNHWEHLQRGPLPTLQKISGKPSPLVPTNPCRPTTQGSLGSPCPLYSLGWPRGVGGQQLTNIHGGGGGANSHSPVKSRAIS